jgi:acyl carrier protein
VAAHWRFPEYDRSAPPACARPAGAANTAQTFGAACTMIETADTGNPPLNLRKYTAVIGFAPSHRFFFSSAMPATQSAAEHELAELIITAVNLEGVAADEIDPEAPLFGTGLGLDSIDALELALEISKRYGFQLRSDDEENRRIFASLRSLSSYIQENRTT